MNDADDRQPALNAHNVLVLLGIIVTVVGIVYFATEFIDRLSNWGKLAILALLTGAFIALGAGFEDASGGRLFSSPRLRWARLPTALYLIGAVGGLVTVIFFVGMDEVDKRVKILGTIAVGLSLIFLAARLARSRSA